VRHVRCAADSHTGPKSTPRCDAPALYPHNSDVQAGSSSKGKASFKRAADRMPPPQQAV
jgi:hypothetical protein